MLVLPEKLQNDNDDQINNIFTGGKNNELINNVWFIYDKFYAMKRYEIN